MTHQEFADDRLTTGSKTPRGRSARRYLHALAVCCLMLCQCIAVPAKAASLVPTALRKPFDKAIEQAAQRNRVDSNLLRAIITVESGFRPAAYHGGAVGLMQVMPATARHFGVHNVHDPIQNIQAGARYVRHLLDMFHNDIHLALAAYNAGEGAILKRRGGMPATTHVYVARVMNFWQSYQAAY